jgi:hypothetical protein
MALTKIRGNTQIQALTVSNSEIAFKDGANPDGILLVKIEDGELLVKSDGSVPFTAPIAGVSPVSSNDLATKSYVDGVATGLDVKNSVRAISLTPVSLTGLAAVDGVPLIAGDRVLVAGQAAGEANGIYVVGPGAWVRSTDADNSTAGEVTTGMFTFVEEGTNNGGSGWVLSTPGPITLGTTPLTFSQFSEAGQITAGGGLTLTGTTVDVVSANAGIVVNADNIALNVSADGTLVIGADGIKMRALAPGQVFVGNNGSVATPTTLSGDISVDSAGVVTISPGAVGAASISDHSLSLVKLADGTGPGQIIVTDSNNHPAYATPTGDVTISATGDIQIKTGVVGTNELTNSAVTNAKLADDAVSTSRLQDASVTLAKLFTVPAGQIIMGTAGGNVTVTPSGDATISEAGVITINPASVVRVADIVKRETPTGLVNGTNTAFTLANAPKPGTEDVYVNGILQEGGSGNDYTISGATLTMLFPLQPGDKLRVSYLK